MDTNYTAISYFYDMLNSEVDYEKWADFLSAKMNENGVPDNSLVLDLGCGTGTMALLLAEKGYDMIGIDLSVDMLNQARKKDIGSRVLWLNQDMTSFELYGTVKGVVCSLDCINYILKRNKLADCFSLVHNYLECGGVFIFDVNSKYKFEKIYSCNDYILEEENVFCGWRNYYNVKTGNCDFDLTFFYEKDGQISRYDEHQREHFWSEKILEAELEKSGFDIIGKCSDIDGTQVDSESERIFYISKCRK